VSLDNYASRNRSDKDGAEVKELNRMFDSGRLHSDVLGITFNSMDDLKKKLDETYTAWQNDIKETYSLESEIADLMKEKYQAELDMLKELIDAKKEELNAEKDLHDYNRTLQEKTKNISTIQKQIAAYSGDTSQEGLAKLQKLRKELNDAKDDLKETEYDRYISDQQDMLDKLYEEYEELVTKKLEDFMGLVKEGLELANNNMSSIEDYLNQIADQNGYALETEGLFHGLNGNINTNVDRIISAIVSNATKDSGTIPNGQGASTGGSSTPESTPTTDATTNASPAAPMQNDSDKINLVRDFIAWKSEKTNKKKDDFGGVNRRIYENESKSYKGTGRILSGDRLKELSKLLGVKYDNATKSGNLFKKLKSIHFPGFKKGGVVSVDDIERQVKQNGDDGIASVKNGEAILTPAQTDLFKKFTENMPELIASVDMNHLVKIDNPIEHLKQLSAVRNASNTVNIDMGGISMYGVNDPKQFADQIVYSLQKYPKVQKTIHSVEMDRLTGSGRLSVNNIR